MNNPLLYYYYRVYDYQNNIFVSSEKVKTKSMVALAFPLFLNGLMVIFLLAKIFKLNVQAVLGVSKAVQVAVIFGMFGILWLCLRSDDHLTRLELKYSKESKEDRIRNGVLVVLYPILSFVLFVASAIRW